jgi:hypothetical protein
MDAQLEEKLIRIIARHEQFLKRVARMVAADARGDPMPPDAEFNTQELKSLDSNTSDLSVELTGSMPLTSDWAPPVHFAYEHGYAKPGVMTWLKELERGLRLSKRYFENFLPLAKKEVHVGDNINVGLAHVVLGSHASAGNITTHGAVVGGDANQADLKQIAEELATLRKALRQVNVGDEMDKDSDIGAIACAEKAARNDDRNGMLNHLKTVGTWVLDTATKVGVDLASAALKSASGLGS